MDLKPSREEAELQVGVRTFLEREITRERLAAWDATPEGYDASFWDEISRLGWIGLSLPEALGGSGGSLLDAALVLEECGRALAPPALSVATLGARAFAAVGREALAEELPSVARGEATVAIGLESPDGEPLPVLSNGRVTGRASYVRQAVSARWLLVQAESETGPVIATLRMDDSGARRHDLETFGGDRQSHVELDGAEVAHATTPGESTDAALRRIRDEAVAFALAEAVGGQTAVLDMTVAYVKEREQFGQPVGKFQGVQFRLADLATLLSGTRHVAFQAIWRLSNGIDAARELSIAKAWCGRAYKEMTLEAHQLHGGAGYIVEHPLRRYSERAQAGSILFLRRDEGLREVATALLGPRRE